MVKSVENGQYTWSGVIKTILIYILNNIPKVTLTTTNRMN